MKKPCRRGNKLTMPYGMRYVDGVKRATNARQKIAA
jgi:hypothetical protein